VDVRRVSYVLGKGLRSCRRHRPHFSWPARHGGGPLGHCGRQRAADRGRDRPLIEGRRGHSWCAPISVATFSLPRRRCWSSKREQNC